MDKVVHELMVKWKVLQVIANIDQKYRGKSEGTWVSVSGIEIPTFTFCGGKKLMKEVYQRKLNNVKKI